MTGRERYRRQKRYFASGLFSEPPEDEMCAFWAGWDYAWCMKRPGRRIAQTVAWLAFAAAIMRRGR